MKIKYHKDRISSRLKIDVFGKFSNAASLQNRVPHLTAGYIIPERISPKYKNNRRKTRRKIESLLASALRLHYTCASKNYIARVKKKQAKKENHHRRHPGLYRLFFPRLLSKKRQSADKLEYLSRSRNAIHRYIENQGRSDRREEKAGGEKAEMK